MTSAVEVSLKALHICSNDSSLIYFYSFDKEGLRGGDFYILRLKYSRRFIFIVSSVVMYLAFAGHMIPRLAPSFRCGSESLLRSECRGEADFVSDCTAASLATAFSTILKLSNNTLASLSI